MTVRVGGRLAGVPRVQEKIPMGQTTWEGEVEVLNKLGIEIWTGIMRSYSRLCC